jgi:hypothetical protein
VTSATSPAPPGWYPDPGGERQWRVWTGTEWSDTTRPFSELARDARPPSTATYASAPALLRRYGVVSLFAGLGLLVSVLAHWPGTAHPSPTWFAFAASDLAIGLLTLGSVLYALGARALLGRWTPAAVVPGLNVMFVSGLLGEALEGRWPTRRVVSEAIILTLFVAEAHAQAWLAMAPVLVGLTHLSALNAVGDPTRLSGSTLVES